MGALGLYKLLRPYMIFMGLSALADTLVGLDASFMIHVILARHAAAILLHRDWSGFDSDVRDTLQYLREKEVNALLVFDGRRVSAKTTNSERAERRTVALFELQLESEAVKELWA